MFAYFLESAQLVIPGVWLSSDPVTFHADFFTTNSVSNVLSLGINNREKYDRNVASMPAVKFKILEGLKDTR